MPTENQVLSQNEPSKKTDGRPKSGRIWKQKKQRFSSIKNQRALRTTFEEKLAKRAERKSLKEYEGELAEKEAAKKAAKKAEREARAERILEKARKAEVVQVISNTRKIKKMSKRQLRALETR
eukprot:CFRG7114T1